MGWFTKLEQAAAAKLKAAFVDAKDLAEHASDEVTRAEQALQAARVNAAKLAKQAQLAAQQAAAKAQEEADALLAAARLAEDKALYHAKQLQQSVPDAPKQ